ncbi:MAG: type II toxin-antitoxin system VapC family toxin [Acidobacteriia bacterium]|nr:type II toxin-antitoxin system VapC family toxin [Terriglobia bacterium]
MKLLLDTHIWIWSLADPHRLKSRVLKALENPANEKWISPISIWELMILVGKGRIRLNADVGEWIAQALQTAPLREAPLTTEVVLATHKIHLPHRDPADAFLAATAKVFDLTLVTADTRLLAAKGISFLPNR